MLYQVTTGHGIYKQILKTFASLIDANNYARKIPNATVSAAFWTGPTLMVSR